jgi:hypothetical protein
MSSIILVACYTHERTPLPNLDTVPQNHKGYKAERQRNESQQAAGPVEAQGPIHTLRSKRQEGSHEVLEKGHTSDSASGVLCIRIKQVRRQRSGAAEHAEADKRERNTRHDPMHRRIRRPREEEQAACKPQKRRRDAEIQPRLGNRVARVHGIAARGAEVDAVLDDRRSEPDDLANHNRALHHSRAEVRPAVQPRVDLDDGLGEHEGGADDEGGPQAERQDDALCAEHVRGPDERLGEEGAEAEFFLFGARGDGLAGCLAQVARALREDYVGAHFGEEEEEDGEEGGVEDYLGDEDPRAS